MHQEVLCREVRFNSVFAQVTDTQDLFLSRLPHGTHIVSDDFRGLNQICRFSEVMSSSHVAADAAFALVNEYFIT